MNPKWPCYTTVIRKIVLFAHNFKRTLESSGPLQDDSKIQYLSALVCGEALRQFDMLSADVEIGTPLTLDNIILRLST